MTNPTTAPEVTIHDRTRANPGAFVELTGYRAFLTSAEAEHKAAHIARPHIEAAGMTPDDVVPGFPRETADGLHAAVFYVTAF